MHKSQYRVESSHTILCPFLPREVENGLVFNDRSLAIVVAAKSLTSPQGEEIRVVNTLSGEVVYRKTDGVHAAASDD